MEGGEGGKEEQERATELKKANEVAAAAALDAQAAEEGAPIGRHADEEELKRRKSSLLEFCGEVESRSARASAGASPRTRQMTLIAQDRASSGTEESETPNSPEVENRARRQSLLRF